VRTVFREEGVSFPLQLPHTSYGMKPTRAEVDASRIEQWLPLVRAYAIPTVCLPLPASFLDFLAADGLRLPAPPGDDYDALPASDPRKFSRVRESEPEERLEGEEESSSDEEEGAAPAARVHGPFPEIEAFVRSAVERWGSVFPRLSFSAPRDAAWTANNSLRCQSAGEVFQLLKASELVSFDLMHAYADVEEVDGAAGGEAGRESAADAPKWIPQNLALRQWLDLQPGMEFRVFVHDGRIVCASQRHAHDFFPFLLREGALASISAAIAAAVVPKIDELLRPLIQRCTPRKVGLCWGSVCCVKSKGFVQIVCRCAGRLRRRA
jgi:D123